jgi:peptidoglycan/LPS O-acetylase OafA/YrhL
MDRRAGRAHDPTDPWSVVQVRAPKRTATPKRSRPVLAEAFSGRANSINVLRLLCAYAVIVSHSWPLGLGRHDLGFAEFNGQADLGKLGVAGFFVISGFLVTRSGGRSSLARFAWHRALRIFPGYWVCLLLLAFVLAPLLWLREHPGEGLGALFSQPSNPLSYVTRQWWTATTQHGIAGLLTGTPRDGGHGSTFNGALWSLRYELLCYVLVAVLAVTGVLRRWRWGALVLTAVLLFLVLRDTLVQLAGNPRPFYPTVDLPLVADVHTQPLVYLALLFLLGACLHLFAERVPVSGRLAALCAIVLVGTLLTIGYHGLGEPALAYLLLWLAVRLPSRLHGIGRRHDLSYGLYIYGWPIQITLVSLGLTRRDHGFPLWVACSLLLATGAAWLSWNLVERRALAWKDWQPALPRRRGRLQGESSPATGPAPEEPRELLDSNRT